MQEHRGEYPSLWAAVESIAPKIGCVASTLLDWVKQTEVDAASRAGVEHGPHGVTVLFMQIDTVDGKYIK